MSSRTRKMIEIVYYNRLRADMVVYFVAIISLLLVFTCKAAPVKDSAREPGNDVLSSQTIQDLVQPLLFQVDSNLAISKSYAMEGFTVSWFPDIAFVQIDTFPLSPLPRDPGNIILMAAFSVDGQAFRLRGFQPNDFNQLVEQSEITVDSASALDYGKEYLRLTTLYDPYLVDFLSTRTDFLNQNKHIAEQGLNGLNDSAWVAESALICRILPEEQLEQILADTTLDTHHTVHHVWLLSTGHVIRIELEIESDGHCAIVDSNTVGTEVGSWREQAY